MSKFATVGSLQVPEGRSGHALLHRQSDKNENIILVGGYNDTGPLADIWVFDLSRNIWQEIMGGSTNRGPLPRVDFDACILGNKLFVFGGMESDGDQALIYNDLWSFDLDSRIWTMLDEEAPVSERMGHVCVPLDADHMVVHGGTCVGKFYNDCWLYTASTAMWQKIHDNIDNSSIAESRAGAGNDVPYARSSHTACKIPNENRIALFAGCAYIDGETTQMNDLWLMDTSSGYGNLAAWSWMRVQGTGGADGAGMSAVALVDVDDVGDDEAVFPSPRDLPALLPVSTIAGPRLLVLGGFGLHEVGEEDVGEEDEDEEEGDGEGGDRMEGVVVAGASASASVSRDPAGKGEDEIELGYLSDLWSIDLSGTCLEIDEGNVTFVPHNAVDAADSETAWSNGGAKRGCKLVQTSKGILSFGGFDGTNFCNVLELMDIKL